jgi:hypothetical protein
MNYSCKLGVTLGRYGPELNFMCSPSIKLYRQPLDCLDCFGEEIWTGRHYLPTTCYYHRRRRRRLQGLGLMACSDSEFNFSEFMNLRTFSWTPWMGDQPNARPLPTQDNTTQYNTEKRGHTSMPREGFEPAIPVFER